ncbi:MAG: hypothetical protein JSS56_21805 [Proteobacteria bacterium]|nr:hypothetical protein [Pseudomonadota bacterium]
MSTPAPRFSIEEIRFFERDVVLRLPFRFGAATVTSCPQVYVRARIRLPDGRTSEGCAAEMLIPKWFDKNPELSNEDNFAQLRRALQLARAAYTCGTRAQTAWRHFASHYQALLDAGEAAGLNPLATCYGPALIDRALLDALCLHASCSFAHAMSANLCGMVPAELAPDLQGFDFDAFAKSRQPRRRIAARHTVGLADAIEDAELAYPPRDGLPASLQAAIARYGHRHFKLKLCGDTDADVQRLARIAQLADPVAELVTLDGNEQYADAAAFQDFLDAFLAEPSLRGLAGKCAFIEQPIQRAAALQHDLSAAAQRMPLLVDESDSRLDSFVQAQPLGYTGVSSKSCKGFYKSAINAARCARAGVRRRLFLSGEDLTMQAGVGVQQDLALVGWLGLAHVERNGHHYVNGMAALPEDEQRNFLRAHPALYVQSDGAVRLRIENGQIDLGSVVGAAGFGGTGMGAGIQWDAMRTNW